MQIMKYNIRDYNMKDYINHILYSNKTTSISFRADVKWKRRDNYNLSAANYNLSKRYLAGGIFSFFFF